MQFNPSTNEDVIKNNLIKLFLKTILIDQEMNILEQKPDSHAAIKNRPFEYMEYLLSQKFYPNDKNQYFIINYKYFINDFGETDFNIFTFTLKYDGEKIFKYSTKPNISNYNIQKMDYQTFAKMSETCNNFILMAKECLKIAIQSFYENGYNFLTKSIVNDIRNCIEIRNKVKANNYISDAYQDEFDKSVYNLSDTISIEMGAIIDKFNLKNIYINLQILEMPFNHFTKYEDKDIPFPEFDLLTLTKNSGKDKIESVYAIQVNNTKHIIENYSENDMLPQYIKQKIAGYLYIVCKYIQILFYKEAIN